MAPSSGTTDLRPFRPAVPESARAFSLWEEAPEPVVAAAGVDIQDRPAASPSAAADIPDTEAADIPDRAVVPRPAADMDMADILDREAADIPDRPVASPSAVAADIPDKPAPGVLPDPAPEAVEWVTERMAPEAAEPVPAVVDP